MQALLLILKVLPLFLSIVKMLMERRLTLQATEEVVASLQQAADYLIMRSNLARAEVKDTDEAVIADEFNRDRP